MPLAKIHRVARPIKALANYPLSMLRPFNACMWHAGRCGSTVLGDLLMQDDRVRWGSEVLEQYSTEVATYVCKNKLNSEKQIVLNSENLGLYLEQLENGKLNARFWRGATRRLRYHALFAGAKIFGLEIKLWHLMRLGVDAKTALEFFDARKYVKHIVLERQNYLRIMISGSVARVASRYHYKLGERVPAPTLRLEPGTLESDLDIYRQFYAELKRLLEGRCLWITYEDDILRNPVDAYKKVVDYFGLTARDVAVNYQRTNAKSLKDLVQNYEEAQDALHGTRYEWMISDRLPILS